ncbi:MULTISPECIES: anti-sigma factor [unclassified Sphingomonas]|uniref:anti-sigma factor n=1 Tax=unclassified Sphingomonas TaxID=196159 RepID=UPI0012E0FB7A|nr:MULTISPECIES: anti-sigma factor [unclassified Sphingomonas]
MTIEPDMTAAELALGLLEGDERAQALRRMLSEPEFAREVEWWRAKFALMFPEYGSEPAPAGLTDTIGDAPDIKPQRMFRFALPAGLAAIAAVLLVMVLQPDRSMPPAGSGPSSGSLLAALQPTDAQTAPISAVVDREAGQVRLAATAVAPVGKVAQLWIIRDGVPRSIGLLAVTGATRLALPAAERAALRPGLVMAISIEPPGGSPKETPTGPVVATGPLVVI